MPSIIIYVDLDKTTQVKRELVNTNLNNDEIEKILDSFLNIIRTKENSLNTQEI